MYLTIDTLLFQLFEFFHIKFIGEEMIFMPTNGQAELNNAFQIINLEAETLKNILSLTQRQLLLLPHSNPIEKEMSKQLKNGNVTLIGVENQYDGNKLQSELHNNGVPHAMYVSVSSSSSKNNERMHFIAIHNSEMEAARSIINAFQRERSRGGITDPCLFGRYADQSIRVIENVDNMAAMMFNRYCEQAHIPILLRGPDGSELWQIVYAEKDNMQMDLICDSVAIDMSGEYGNIVKRQLEWENNYRINARNIILNGRDEHGEKLPVETALVDQEGREIEIKRTSMIFRDGNVEKSIPLKREDEIERAIKGLFREMKDPVLLANTDYEKFKNLSENEKSNFLIDIERRSGRPVLSRVEMEVVAATEVKRTAIQQKLNQSVYGSLSELQNPYNVDQSFWGFKEAELENYQDIHDRFESRFADGELFNEANAIDDGLMEEIRDRREELEDYSGEMPLSAIITQSQVMGDTELDDLSMSDASYDIPSRDIEDMTLDFDGD